MSDKYKWKPDLPKVRSRGTDLPVSVKPTPKSSTESSQVPASTNQKKAEIQGKAKEWERLKKQTTKSSKDTVQQELTTVADGWLGPYFNPVLRICAVAAVLLVLALVGLLISPNANGTSSSPAAVEGNVSPDSTTIQSPPATLLQNLGSLFVSSSPPPPPPFPPLSPSAPSACSSDAHQYSVMDYGAIGDGIANDTEAIVAALKDVASKDTGLASILLPAGKIFRSWPLEIGSNTRMCILGTLVFPDRVTMCRSSDTSACLMDDPSLPIAFLHLKGSDIEIGGTGVLDASVFAIGDKIFIEKWPHKPFTVPSPLGFQGCRHCNVQGLKVVGSTRDSIIIAESSDVTVDRVSINVPSFALHSSGVHVTHSSNVIIEGCNIVGADAFVKFMNGTKDALLRDSHFESGTAVMIGPLTVPKGKRYDQTVENISMRNLVFNNTINAVSLRTVSSAVGYIRNVSIEHVSVQTSGPVFDINQYFCVNSTYPNAKRCSLTPQGKPAYFNKAVRISDVSVRDFTGTSQVRVVSKMNCSPKTYCSQMSFERIQLKVENTDSKFKPKTICECVTLVKSDDNSPPICLETVDIAQDIVTVNKFSPLNATDIERMQKQANNYHHMKNHKKSNFLVSNHGFVREKTSAGH